MAGLRICGLLMAMALAANWPGSDWVGQAWADDAPPLLPTRDVVVTYKQVGHGGARDIKISQRAQSSVMRVETSGQPGYVLVDRQSQRSTAVMEAQGYYLEMSANRVPQEGQWPDDKISFTRGKDDMVAGQGCTNWDYKTARGNGTDKLRNAIPQPVHRAVMAAQARLQRAAHGIGSAWPAATRATRPGPHGGRRSIAGKCRTATCRRPNHLAGRHHAATGRHLAARAENSAQPETAARLQATAGRSTATRSHVAAAIATTAGVPSR